MFTWNGITYLSWLDTKEIDHQRRPKEQQTWIEFVDFIYQSAGGEIYCWQLTTDLIHRYKHITIQTLIEHGIVDYLGNIEVFNETHKIYKFPDGCIVVSNEEYSSLYPSLDHLYSSFDLDVIRPK